MPADTLSAQPRSGPSSCIRAAIARRPVEGVLHPQAIRVRVGLAQLRHAYHRISASIDATALRVISHRFALEGQACWFQPEDDGGSAVVGSGGAARSLDLTRETNGDLQQVVAIRVDAPPTAPANLTMRSGEARAVVPLGRLERLPTGRWTTFGVPLKCFEAAGGDMKPVDVPFALNVQGAVTVSLADVRLQPSAENSLACDR